MFIVAHAESTNTGVAPQYVTAFAVAMKVSDGTMTSSPGDRSSARRARWSALVPLLHATTYRTSQKAAKLASNGSMNAPNDDTQPVRRHSATYRDSFPD